MNYRIIGKHLVLEGGEFPRLFPQAKTTKIKGTVFTAVPYEGDVCRFLATRGYTIPIPPFDKYRILGKHIVLEGEQFPAIFPQAKSSKVNGTHFTALPYDVPTCQVLNNLGYKVDSPIRTNYPFKSKYPKPMQHQVETADFLTTNRRAFNLSGMGTAKSLSSLWAADYLMREGLIRRVLIIAPLSTLQVVWGKEIFTNFPNRSFAVLHGSRDTRKELCEQAHDFYVVNHHGVQIVSEHLPDDIDLVIVDEVAIYRTHTTGLWKALKAFIKPHHWVWGLTGTPTPNCPTDAYGQMKLIVPERYPGMSFTRCKQMMMLKLSMFKWIPRKGSEQQAYEMLQPSIRYDLGQCLDMPETIYQERECGLSKEQVHHYKTIERECITEINGVQITAVNSAVLLGKLIQASCISKGTLVVTNVGLIPIEKVTELHKVWDGEYFVTHEGVVFKGVKSIVSCGGILLTEDHKLLTEQGWFTAKEINDGKSSKRYDWPEVRTPNGYSKSWDYIRSLSNGNLGMPLRLRERSHKNWRKFKKKEQNRKQTLWLYYRHLENTRYEQDTTIQHMVTNDSKMLQQKEQRLQKLWWSWYSGLQRMGRFFRAILGRYATHLPRWFKYRKSECERSLLQRELQVGDTKRTIKQQKKLSIHRNSERSDDSGPSCGGIRVEQHHITREDIPIQMGCVESVDRTSHTTSESVQEVYDIVNCGSLNRFTVVSAEGEARIVHNCGVVYGTDGEIAKLDFGPRLSVLTECIEACNEKVIVFVPLTAMLKALYDKLSKKWGCGVIDGSVSSGKRTQIFNEFQDGTGMKVLLANPSAMSHGINLTAATTTIWYCPIHSNEVYQQANARMRRPGQKKVMNIVHMYGTKLESKIYKRLQEKGDMQELVLDLVKESM